MAFEEFTGKFDPLPKYEEFKGEFEPLDKKKKGPKILDENDTSSDFLRGLSNTPGSLEETYGAAKALTGLAAKKLGADQFGQEVIKSGLEHMESGKARQTVKKTDDFEEAWHKGIGAVVTDWLPYQMGAGVGNLAETAAFSLLGAGAGAVTGAGVGALPGAVGAALSRKLVERGIETAAKEVMEKTIAEEIAKGATKEIAKDAGKSAMKAYTEAQGKKILTEEALKSTYKSAAARGLGADVGQIAQAGMHGAGEVMGRVLDEAEKNGTDINDINLGRVLPAALVHSVGDYINERVGLGALKIGEGAAKNLVTEILKRVAVTGAKETGGEEIQTLAERFGANLSLTDAEAISDYVNTAAASFGMAVIPSSVGGYRARSHAKDAEVLNGKAQQENSDTQKSTDEQKDAGRTKQSTLNPEHLSILKPAVGENNTALTDTADTTTEAIKNNNSVANRSIDEVSETNPNAPRKLTSLTPAEKNMTAEQIEARIAESQAKPPAKGKHAEKRADLIARLQNRLEELKNAEQPNGQPGGTSTAVVQPTDQGQPAAGAPGPDTSGVVSTGQDVGVPNAGETTKPSTVKGKVKAQPSPYMQKKIDDLIDQIDQLKDSGIPETNPTYVKKLTELNKLKAKNNISDGTEFFAHKDEGPVFKYDSSKSPEENTKAAMALQQHYEQDQKEKERLEKEKEQQLTKEEVAEREQKVQDKYPLAQAFYEEVSQEIKDQVESHNAKHDEISGRFKLVDEEHRKASDDVLDIQDKLDDLSSNEQNIKQSISEFEEDVKNTKNLNEKKLLQTKIDVLKNQLEKLVKENDPVAARLREQEAEARRKEEEALDRLMDIEDELKEHGPRLRQLPEWASAGTTSQNRLTDDKKDIYFSHITTGKKTREQHLAEHRKAARALLEYIENTTGRGRGYKQETLTAEQRRIINNYEENRDDAHRIFGIVFPRWDRLSQEAKDIYLQSIVDNSGLQHDDAFYKLGVQLINEKRNLTETQRQAEFDNINKYKRAATAISEKNQAKYAELREKVARSTSPITPYVAQKSAVSEAVIGMIKDNNINGVLKSLKEEPLRGDASVDNVTSRINKLVAGLLGNLQLATQIRFAKEGELSHDVLAKYDTKTDTVIYGKDGLTKSTILHEIVHAGTVKIIHLVKSGQTALLSAQQILGVKRLEEIMNQTKEILGDSYPKAYKNLYEFVAYAMTSKTFQDELHNYAPSIYHNELFASELGTKPAERIESIAGSMWTSFTKAIAKVLGVTKGNIGKSARANYLLEVSSAFEQILSVPQVGMDISETLNATKQAEKEGISKNTIFVEKDPRYEDKNPAPKSLVEKILYNFSYQGMKDVATNFVDERYEAKVLQNSWDAVGKIIRDPLKNFNNFYDKLNLAQSRAKGFFVKYLSEPSHDLDVAVSNFATQLGLPVDDARKRLHAIAEMFGEKERRHIKWLLFVPLSTKNVLNNGTLNPAQRRIDLIGDRSKGIPGIVHKVELDEAQLKQIRAELEALAKNYADPLGYGGIYENQSINENSDEYNALGLSVQDIADRQKEYNDPANAKMKQLAEKVFEASKKLTDATKELDKISGFWSFPVSNFVGIYDYQHYLPFKGVPEHAKIDAMLDPHRIGKGKEFQEITKGATGRTSTANDPLLQAMVDSIKAAGRAGRADLTQSLKNALPYHKKYNPEGTGILKGKIEYHIPFSERETFNFDKLKGGKSIFHYNKDGSIDVLLLDEGKVLDAIRRTYRETSPTIDLMNKVTSFFGKQHTRYNFQFAPLNFTRDSLTNAFFIGAKYGPRAAAAFVREMSDQIVINKGLPKAMEIAYLHERGDVLSQNKMKSFSDPKSKAYDPYKAAMLEYINNGGKSTYLMGYSLHSQLEELSKELGRNKLVRSKEQFEKLIDTWTDMFEFASRTAAFKILRDRFYQEELKKPDATKEGAMQAAIDHAVSETKNLANFEQVGKYGKSLGALYMFIRPSATGALTAIEAVTPAFMSVKEALSRQPTEIQSSKELSDKFIAQYKEKQSNARHMVAGLVAAGMITYWMASLMAPDDEWKRNAVKSDNMQQWTRFARFHIPGTDTVFQVPWGFGLGAFAAAGAQIAAALSGAQPIGDALSNIFLSISLDSFVPIPISKMPPAEMPLEFLLDSITPSIVRPLLEFAMNKNGLGQNIYNDQNRRFGDAFTGGDKIPEVYKTIARELAISSGGSIDWSPNTLYFLSNSYLDGVARLGEFGYGIFDLTQGRKDFSPKNDMFLFNSFFGAKSNVDSREFTKAEKQILDMEGKLNEFKKASPIAYANYMAKNPLAEVVVSSYNSQLNNNLNPLREEAKTYRLMQGLTPKQRDEILKNVTQRENLVKHNMVDMFKIYGVNP